MSDWGATHPTTEQYANAGLDMEYELFTLHVEFLSKADLWVTRQPGDFILIGEHFFNFYILWHSYIKYFRRWYLWREPSSGQ